jgi:hypothetical protein
MELTGHTDKANINNTAQAILNVNQKLASMGKFDMPKFWQRVEEIGGKNMHDNSLSDLTVANLLDILVEQCGKLYKR